MRTILEHHGHALARRAPQHRHHHYLSIRRRGAPILTAASIIAVLAFGGQARGEPDPREAASEPKRATTVGLWPGSASPDTVVLNVVGDISYPNDWGGIEEIDRRKHALFEQVQPILDSADLNFANIECPLTDTPASVTKEFPIACQQKRLAYMTDAGFNLFSLANNHSSDAGAGGIQDTLELLHRENREDRPLWWSGTGANADDARKPTIVAPPGKNTRIALFAVANGGANGRVASVHDATLPERISAAAREADLVLVSVHFGPEYVHVPTQATVHRYHAFIDAGADMVIAHHPHVIQGVERYKDGFIFYSLGNFSFGSRTRRHLPTGARLYSMIGRVTFEKDAIARVELIPLYANNGFKWTLGDKTLEQRHATPQLLAGDFAHAALDELEAFTRDVPGAEATRLRRVGDRAFVDLGKGDIAARERAESVHQQAHEYAAVVLVDALPRPATEAEQRVENRGGTPDALVRAAQAKAERDQQRGSKKRGKKRGAKARGKKAKGKKGGAKARGKRR